MKYLELEIPGRPVPWARARVRRHGGMFTASAQYQHRLLIAGLIQCEMRDEGLAPFSGPCFLQALFIYGKKPGTWLRLSQMDTMENLEPLIPYEVGEEYRTGRPDIDNLVKQLMEAIEDSGILAGEDSQIAMVTAAKAKR